MQFLNLNWRDGQPYNDIYDDIYYSSDKDECIAGEKEFKHVFFNNNGLPERWSNRDRFIIAELGFGSGLNCILTIREWLNQHQDNGRNKCLHYIAIEKHPLSADSIKAIISRYPELDRYCDEIISSYPPAIAGSHSRHLFDNRVVVHYKFMDAFQALRKEDYKVDAWYLDGFSPAKNADMWTLPLFEKIAQNSHPGTTCSTYTSAGFVKRHLQNAGFEVTKVSGFGRKREMLTARFEYCKSEHGKPEHCKPKPLRFTDKPWFAPPSKVINSSREATVIGAGIAGLSMAYSLIKRGWKVTVIDQHSEVAAATSSNPAAIVYPRLSVDNDVDTQFYTEAYCYALSVLKKLQAEHEKRFWFDDGLLQFVDEKKIFQIINKFQFNEDFIAIAEIDKLAEPIQQAIKKTHQLCVEYKTAGVVIPKILCDILVEECGKQLTIRQHEVRRLTYTNTVWQCLSEDAVINETETLVVANGIQVNNLGIDINFPVDTVRGQVAVLKAEKGTDEFEQAISTSVYLTPVIDHKHYLGASYARNNNCLTPIEADNKSLLNDFNALFPSVFSERSVLDSWVGLRATSKDRVPVVGAVPDMAYFNNQYADINSGKQNKVYSAARHLKGLYVSAAHGSRGFTSSFLCAELIASQIEGEPAPISKMLVDYLNPSRFTVNDLKRG